MDARPQRPLRTMRTFNDENVLPSGPLPKTIHQRNKSSPALANIGGAALKAAAKRTAFGDVSNIVHAQRFSKDDSTSGLKSSLHSNVKLEPTAQTKLSAPLLRPAQRPLSVSNLKSLLNGPLDVGHLYDYQHKPATNDPVTIQPTANSRKALTKRATTVFKDLQLETVQEHDLPEPQKKQVHPVSTQDTKLAPVDVTIPNSNSPLHLSAPQSRPVQEPVKVADLPPVQIKPAEQLADEPRVQTTSLDEAVSTEVNPNIPASKLSLPASILDHASTSIGALAQAADEQLPLVDLTNLDAAPLPPIHQVILEQPLAPISSNAMPVSHRPEPEEYWGDYEEDGYEEDAYVTARSFRSRGENTTGGVTTVLVPRMNQKARKEIEAATKLVEATRTSEEIEDEAYDTSMVAQYGDEIFEYMRQLEVKMSPNPHYMDNQHEIQWSMRSVLMDWLVQVHHRFNLLPETLFLCVNYIDRFLSSKVVSLGKLQLVGATAIFIAAKYEEINCPSVQEIVYMVDGGYSIDEILKAERFMLTMLQFELGWPGPMSFLRRISKADDYDLETRTLAKYFLEVTLMDERFIASPPSFTAAASHCLARMMLRKGVWSPHHVYYSGYTYSQLKPLVQLLLDCCEEPRKHHSAVYNKYCDKRYKRAAAFVETEIARGFMLQQQSPVVNSYLQSSTYAFYSETQYMGF